MANHPARREPLATLLHCYSTILTAGEIAAVCQACCCNAQHLRAECMMTGPQQHHYRVINTIQ